MKASDIRERFIKYFEATGHKRVKSSSLIPAADPTLLFTNAGMVQFKDAFLGLQNPSYRRATTCQKCVRAGGKHNDLENVGFTARHHTFFEMLGNFSFGDYFKTEAIHYGWELVTKQFQIPKDRLWITVFKEDDQAFELWRKQGVPTDRILRLGEKDNFWAMGDTGPCGPCTEIHFDWGTQYGCQQPSCNPGCECGTRFLEIWNLVFMQFDRTTGGKMVLLPKPSVDTGAGLERFSAVLQNVYSNYDTDLFLPIRVAIEKITEKQYGSHEDTDVSIRVISDHVRAGTFLLSDGVFPSNEGRGYVLRRILRRAIRHGKKLGIDTPFIHKLVGTVVDIFKDEYPELASNRARIAEQFREEEQKFHETLHRGIGLLEEHLANAKKMKRLELSGEIAFKLYDTFGFPIDLIEVISREHGLIFDSGGFNRLMEKQRSQSVAVKAGSGSNEALARVLTKKNLATKFLGYKTLSSSAKALWITSLKAEPARSISDENKGMIVFDQTPFYAESGGQVGDVGIIRGQDCTAKVENTFKIGKTILHQVAIESGKLSVGKTYHLSVDSITRSRTAINHTATHLLHAALRSILGERVKQAGSLVEPTRLRFDFTFPRGLTDEEVLKVEKLVNDQIQGNFKVDKEEMGYERALKSGALAFFDEKYGSSVRVIRVGPKEAPFSIELCGGTHLNRTVEIGNFKIVGETSVASGVRRIDAITANSAIEYLGERSRQLGDVEKKLSVRGLEVLQKIDAILAQNKVLSRENEDLKVKTARSGTGADSPSVFDKVIVGKDGIQIVAGRVETANPKILRTLVDQVQDKLKKKVAVFLVTESQGKVSFCVGLSSDLTSKFNASDIAKHIAPHVGGTGGGRADFAQAGGTDVSGIEKALIGFKSFFEA